MVTAVNKFEPIQKKAIKWILSLHLRGSCFCEKYSLINIHLFIRTIIFYYIILLTKTTA